MERIVLICQGPSCIVICKPLQHTSHYPLLDMFGIEIELGEGPISGKNLITDFQFSFYHLEPFRTFRNSSHTFRPTSLLYVFVTRTSPLELD